MALILHLSRGEHCPRERRHHIDLLRFHEWCPVAFAGPGDDHAQHTSTTSSASRPRPARTGPPLRRGPRGPAATSTSTSTPTSTTTTPHAPHGPPLRRASSSTRSTSATGSGADLRPSSCGPTFQDLFARIKPDFDPTVPLPGCLGVDAGRGVGDSASSCLTAEACTVVELVAEHHPVRPPRPRSAMGGHGRWPSRGRACPSPAD